MLIRIQFRHSSPTADSGLSETYLGRHLWCSVCFKWNAKQKECFAAKRFVWHKNRVVNLSLFSAPLFDFFIGLGFHLSANEQNPRIFRIINRIINVIWLDLIAQHRESSVTSNKQLSTKFKPTSGFSCFSASHLLSIYSESRSYRFCCGCIRPTCTLAGAHT